jgi:hypothetical protein
MPKTELVPTPRRINGRLFFDYHDGENFKRKLLGLPPLERDPKAPIKLVPANQFAVELGCHRRTLGRRIRAAEQAADAGQAA